MGLSPWHHKLLHNDWGAMVANFITLGLIVGFCVVAARRELFSVLRWFLLILLALTLGWKVALRHHENSSELQKKEDGERKIAEFLVRQRFITLVSEKTTTDLPVILARAGVCRMSLSRHPLTARIVTE